MPETTSPTHHHQTGAVDATCYTGQEPAEAPPAHKPRAFRRPCPDHATAKHHPVKEPPRNPAADSHRPNHLRASGRHNARSGQQGPTRSGRSRQEAARRGEPAPPSITLRLRRTLPRRPWPPCCTDRDQHLDITARARTLQLLDGRAASNSIPPPWARIRWIQGTQTTSARSHRRAKKQPYTTRPTTSFLEVGPGFAGGHPLAATD